MFKKSLTLLVTVSMVLTLISTLSIQASETDTPIILTNSLSAVDIQDNIQNAIIDASSGDTITVTGNKNNENAIITLNIPYGIAVIWKANSKDLSLHIDGGGTFEVATDGIIDVTGKDAITVDNGNVVVSGGKVLLTTHNHVMQWFTAIRVNTGNVLVSNGEVSALRTEINDDWVCSAIIVHDGDVTVTGGKVSAKRNTSTIFLDWGNVIVTGGEVLADGVDGIACYGIRIDYDGVVAVTGGTVSANGALDVNTVISIGWGLGAYYTGTCFGDFEIWYTNYGIIVEVDTLTVSSSYHGSATGLSRMEGGDLSCVSWDTSGIISLICFEYNGYSYSASWEKSITSPVEHPVRLHETGDLFDTLWDAIDAANSAGLKAYALEVIGDVTDTTDVFITSDVTIVGAEGTHTVTFSSGHYIRVQTGGSLTLGDGTNSNIITILGSVDVTDGTIYVKDGITLKNPRSARLPRDDSSVNRIVDVIEGFDDGDSSIVRNDFVISRGSVTRDVTDSIGTKVEFAPAVSRGSTALFLSGPNTKGVISGGSIEGSDVALSMEKGAQLSAISGGVFKGKIDAVHLTDAGTKIDLISGGSFYQTDASVTLHGHAVFVQNDAQIGEISGGYFEGARNSALVLIRGGKVGEISGGEFVVHRTGTIANNDRNAAIWVENGWESEGFQGTGIGTISGGYVKGTNFGILLVADWGYCYLNSITGGTFEGVVAIQNDRGSAIGEISGGTLTGSQGLLNVGTIDKISGNVKISGTTSYGIYNYRGGMINEISGGTISTTSNSENGIANAGTIDKISGGTIIGGWSAISCTGLNPGKLNIITGGVFYAKLSTTITIAYPLELELGLTDRHGVGRYRSGNTNIFNNDALVTYPDGGYYMSLRTMPVEGILGVEFRYLTLDDKYTIKYELDGGVNDDKNPLSYDETDLPCLIVDSTKFGYDFQGWMIKNDTGVFGPLVNYSIDIGSTGDFTLTATWSATKVSYQVHYYLQNSGIPLATSKTLTDQTMGATITEYAIAIAGYTAVVPTTITATLNATDNVFIFYYTLNAPNDDVEYTVHYYREGSTTSLASSKTVSDQTMGDTVTEYAIAIAGYTAVVPTTITITLNAADNVIIFYYTPNDDVEYTVHYYREGSTVALASSKTVSDQTMGDTVTEYAIAIAGYTAVAPTTITATLNATDNVFIFYYTPSIDIDYTVYYYSMGTTNSVAPAKVVTGQTMGASITENAITISGYTAVAPTTVTATLNATNNVFIFYYTATSGSGGSGGGSDGGGSGGSDGGGSGGSWFTVRFVDWDGTLLKSQRVRFGADASAPVDPSREGYTFNGWNRGFTNVRSDIVVTAQYTMKPEVTPPSLLPVEEETWALVNLVLSVAGFVLAIGIGIYVLLQCKKKQKNTQTDNDNYEESGKQRRQHCNFWLVTVLVMGVVGVIVFLVTEDLSRPMGLVDNWTIVNAIIFVVEIIATAFIFKNKKWQRQQNNEKPNFTA